MGTSKYIRKFILQESRIFELLRVYVNEKVQDESLKEDQILSDICWVFQQMTKSINENFISFEQKIDSIKTILKLLDYALVISDEGMARLQDALFNILDKQPDIRFVEMIGSNVNFCRMVESGLKSDNPYVIKQNLSIVGELSTSTNDWLIDILLFHDLIGSLNKLLGSFNDPEILMNALWTLSNIAASK